MKHSKLKWEIQHYDKLSSDSDWQTALSEFEISPQLAPLLQARGIVNREQLRTFLQPNITDLHDPYLMYDMKKAIDRIQKAVAENQLIVIYGDYDADGITSTSILKEALDLVGCEATYYLPNRFEDGYGPNLSVFQRLIAEGAQLIITVDNGVAGHEAIEYAQEQGVDVIVTDHHEIPPTLPKAFAIIHPRHPMGSYPFSDLSGAGVAFKVACALLGEVPHEMLDLVAIGTIADLVSLSDENRILTQLGLSILRSSERIGLVQLCKKASLTLLNVTEKDIGFAIAPRLNALGRLGDATPGVHLLTTFDESEAEELAKYTNKKNEERQKLVKQTTQKALKLIEPQHSGIQILAQPKWHEGILGIVASRIVQQTGRPALVLTIDEETGIAKGSGRSVGQLNLYEMLNQERDLFIHFGGHHMAVGLTIQVDNLSMLETNCQTYAKEHQLNLDEGASIVVEDLVSVPDATISFIDSLQKLAPFGTDNPNPTFLFSSDSTHHLKQIGGDLSHLKFQIEKDHSLLDCIAFNMGDQILEFNPGDNLKIVGQLEINEWNGNRKPQLVVQDFKVEGIQLFDVRGEHVPDDVISKPNVVSILFNSENYPKLKLPSEVSYVLFDDLKKQPEQYLKDSEELLLLDCPVSLEEFKETLLLTGMNRIYLWCYSQEKLYLTGMPTHEEFSRLFHLIKEHKAVDVRYKLEHLSHYLKLNKSVLIFMILVFSDLDFVTIENGIMRQIENPKSQKLTASKVYQKRLEQMKTEEFLLYNQVQDIKKWIIQGDYQC